MADDLQRECKGLIIMADRHLVVGRKRFAKQLALIQRMIEQGYETARVKDLLRRLEDALETWKQHRQLNLDAIARHDAASYDQLPQSSRSSPPPCLRQHLERLAGLHLAGEFLDHLLTIDANPASVVVSLEGLVSLHLSSRMPTLLLGCSCEAPDHFRVRPKGKRHPCAAIAARL